jgi:hypothetical protein
MNQPRGRHATRAQQLVAEDGSASREPRSTRGTDAARDGLGPSRFRRCWPLRCPRRFHQVPVRLERSRERRPPARGILTRSRFPQTAFPRAGAGTVGNTAFASGSASQLLSQGAAAKSYAGALPGIALHCSLRQPLTATTALPGLTPTRGHKNGHIRTDTRDAARRIPQSANTPFAGGNAPRLIARVLA